MRRRIGRIYAALAGACDVATGLLLVAAPALALRLMGVHDAVTELVWMRYIGAFVGSVGVLYFVPLVLGCGGGRLRHVMEATAVVRTGMALFVASSLLSGALSLAWLSVVATDAGLAIAQAVMLRRGVFDDAR